MACKVEHAAPAGAWPLVVETVGSGTVDRSTGELPAKHYRPRACVHCAEPPCAAVCPEGAITRRSDGIVEVDDSRCTGCGYCAIACPYEAFGPPEHWDGRSTATVGRCTFCGDRAEEGPACAAVCPTSVFTFGRRDDPDIAAALARPGAERPEEQLGAEPAVWYLPYTKGPLQRRSLGAWA